MDIGQRQEGRTYGTWRNIQFIPSFPQFIRYPGLFQGLFLFLSPEKKLKK
jgi:hypothetical protein